MIKTDSFHGMPTIQRLFLRSRFVAIAVSIAYNYFELYASQDELLKKVIITIKKPDNENKTDVLRSCCYFEREETKTTCCRSHGYINLEKQQNFPI